VSDPLAAYRRPGAAPLAPAPAREPAREPYRAFATKERAPRVDIRPRGDIAHAFLYSVITEIAYDRKAGAGILLLLAGGKMVKIRGRNLLPVAEALLAGSCSFIEQRDPKRDGADSDPGMPIVESIEILGPKPQQKA